MRVEHISGLGQTMLKMVNKSRVEFVKSTVNKCNGGYIKDVDYFLENIAEILEGKWLVH